MSDNNPKLWVTVNTEDHYPTNDEMEGISENLAEVFGDDYDVILTTHEITPVHPEDAREIAQELIDALDGDGGE